jgi:hypothetical protein
MRLVVVLGILSAAAAAASGRGTTESGMISLHAAKAIPAAAPAVSCGAAAVS